MTMNILDGIDYSTFFTESSEIVTYFDLYNKFFEIISDATSFDPAKNRSTTISHCTEGLMTLAASMAYMLRHHYVSDGSIVWNEEVKEKIIEKFKDSLNKVSSCDTHRLVTNHIH